jgi:hypothetical protein
LSGHDRQTATTANKLADRTFELIDLAYSQGIPGCEENPASSLLWSMRDRVGFIKRDGVVDRIVDQCAYGTSYRKRTRLRCWHFDVVDHERRRCQSTSRVCSFTGVKHHILWGMQDKDFATKAAARYPPQLCSSLGSAFVTRMRRNRVNNLWAVMSGLPSRR